MENQTATVTYITQHGRYRVVIMRAASTSKGVLGYKVEANGDTLDVVVRDAMSLKGAAENMTEKAK